MRKDHSKYLASQPSRTVRRGLMRPNAFAWLLVLGVAPAMAGETIRCGSSLVDESTTVAELLQKCGEPTSKRTEEHDVRARNPNNPGTHKVGTTVVEYWTYDRGTRAAPVLVTIRDGKIRSIQYVQ